MLRVSIPYGLLSTRAAAHARAHRARVRPRLRSLHDAAEHPVQLAEARDRCRTSWRCSRRVEMHAIQTSGNCIRNVTADHLAGVAPDELEDPRPWCEYIRQWATLHPEFSYLPRKFKIAVTGSPQDRAASRVHDIGLHLVRNAAGEVGFEVLVGGGLGRAPMIGHVIREFLPKQDLLGLSRSDPARLQPRRSARQHSQGAHQDPGEGARPAEIPRAGRSRVRSRARHGAGATTPPRSSASRRSSLRRTTRRCRRGRRGRASRASSATGIGRTRASTRWRAIAPCSCR